jgi:hypothetical protein
MKKGLVVILVALTAMLMVYGMADAKVHGLCVNCHTMHNSENGAPMAIEADGGWSGGVLDGTPQADPIPHLLRANCIGCHSNQTADTIVDLGDGNRIPIVRNVGIAPTNPLAGGNFYWVETDDAKGHNIMSTDMTLNPTEPVTMASLVLEGGTNPGVPGGPIEGTAFHCDNACHLNLHNPTRSGYTITGCQGCHYVQFHHKDHGTVTSSNPRAADPTYRYLTGHHYFSRGLSNYVANDSAGGSIEDPNWEQDHQNSATRGNVYKVYGVVPGVINSDNRSVSALCAACHEIFHMTDDPGTTEVEGQKQTTQEGNVWIRHPADQNMPTTGEYASYTYNTEAPVGYTNTATFSGAQVMCISCHRTHGSPNDNMLRWAYVSTDPGGSTMNAAGGNNTTGCFRCHTTKDNP